VYRIEVLGDGRIAYRVKTVRRGRTHRVMTPMELMAQLAALVPPARIPYVSGVHPVLFVLAGQPIFTCGVMLGTTLCAAGLLLM
jgi:hypothetical protein